MLSCLEGSASLFVDLSGLLHGILAVLLSLQAAVAWTPAYPVVYFCVCVCWPPKRLVNNITVPSQLHRAYPVPLLLAQGVTVSANPDRHCLWSHRQGYQPEYP